MEDEKYTLQSLIDFFMFQLRQHDYMPSPMGKSDEEVYFITDIYFDLVQDINDTRRALKLKKIQENINHKLKNNRNEK
jgi:hypothetical protein